MSRPSPAGHSRRCPTRLSAGCFPCFAVIPRLISDPTLSLGSRALRGPVTHVPGAALLHKTLTRFPRFRISAFYPVLAGGRSAGRTRPSAPRPRRPQAAERPGLPCARERRAPHSGSGPLANLRPLCYNIIYGSSRGAVFCAAAAAQRAGAKPIFPESRRTYGFVPHPLQ